MATSFYDRPILNSAYAPPSLHHRLDDTGQPIEGLPVVGPRLSKFVVPVPASRKRSGAAQASLHLETYTENAKINEIRGYLAAWRTIPNPADWGVTPATQRLLEHWRRPIGEWVGSRPFFCQIEAIETLIWLTEVAPRRAATRGLLDQIVTDNAEANPALFRLASNSPAQPRRSTSRDRAGGGDPSSARSGPSSILQQRDEARGYMRDCCRPARSNRSRR